MFYKPLGFCDIKLHLWTKWRKKTQIMSITQKKNFLIKLYHPCVLQPGFGDIKADSWFLKTYNVHNYLAPG